MTPRNRSNITHCPRGHEYSAENTYIGTRNSRNCKACRKALGQKISAIRKLRRQNTTAACRVCREPVKKHQQLCDKHAVRRLKEAVYEWSCVRCGKDCSGRRKGTSKYCSPFCRNEQNILDKLSRGAYASVPDSKTCNTCAAVKPAYGFCINSYSPDGLRNRCRDCDKKSHADWRAKNPDYKDIAREKNLQRTFGVSVSDYDAMLTHQRGVCAVCRKPPVEGKKRMAIDHDHVTGEIRGLLHNVPCNKITVGLHDVTSAKVLLEYLSNPPARSHFGGIKVAARSKATGRRRRLINMT